MNLLKKKEGFTLIELMIVVVIIGILAAIAIPQFLRYQLKSKTSEAPRNLGAIRTNEEAFSAKYGAFAQAAARPGAAANAKKQSWGVDSTSGFDTLGFAPSGTVYYVYGVGTAVPTTVQLAWTTNTTFDATGEPQDTQTLGGGIFIAGQGDVDGDGTFGTFYQTNTDTKIVGVPPVAGETIF